MDKIERKDLAGLFDAVGKIMDSHAEELCEMDAKMGDGDLGLTMKKGFTSLPAIINDIDEPDIGKALMKAGMKMASVVPSTMGTLMASGIMSGGKAIAGKPFIDGAVFAEYLQGFADGIKNRGKCELGDRTVLDSVYAGAKKASEEIEKDPTASLQQVVNAALQGAQQGLEETKSMEPKYGKAAVFKDKAVGVIDQGAYAGMLMIEGYNNYIKN